MKEYLKIIKEWSKFVKEDKDLQLVLLIQTTAIIIGTIIIIIAINTM